MIDDTQAADEAVTEADAPQEAVAQAPGASLSLQDLASLKQIVEVVARRGAFKAEEMSVVGNTYNNLVAFLQSVMPAPEAPAEEEAAPEAAEESAEA